ncbi:endonuclease NucS domain-containing protein [Halomonas lysinitropha]|uniref:Endonuclease NucS n=1 Tax=Halomonas lysinitropha TaxID=2607506 RepID=A0A5K1I3H1_9GAMM|nr:endonuclease NucS domain-containing protein [Halomonas lysinitropha]VVZ94573.1 Endonuclease NucS [Halomonas lysinitropha]
MAIEQGIWKLAGSAGEPPRKLRAAGLADEGLLEEQIMQDVAILNRDWLLVGRQVRTAFDKLVDLLAIDANGNVIIIELKRDKTPRDVVAQAIDYASWVVTLADYQLIEIYRDFAERYSRPHATLGEAFEAKFGVPLDGIQLNQEHQLVVVATRLDASSERIITYLNEHAQLSINAMFFAAFEDGGNRYLSRAWMIDPDEPTQPIARKAKKEPWNGEFYVSFGSHYPWEDARRLGFICGGGAAWYSKTLAMLSEGDRVWVYIPKTGYVGVGEVIGERCRADEYRFDTPEGPRTLPEMTLTEGYPQIDPAKDDDEAEYLVPVRWIYTVSRDKAFSEVGLFGNQNTVCKPTTPKWSHTVSRLKQVWRIDGERATELEAMENPWRR